MRTAGLLRYALAGMDNQLFVSTYQLQLPDKKTLEDFLLRQLEGNTASQGREEDD